MKKAVLCSMIFLLAFLVGCADDSSLVPVAPVEETYEYTTTGRVYAHPAVGTVQQWTEFLSLDIDDGAFYFDTADIRQADEFVNAQRVLLQFLRDSGVEISKLNYYAMDSGDSFSESDKKKAHIALSHVKSHRQVLVTLQTLWGDYTDYGYIYAVSNAIAAHLGWQTDPVDEVDQTELASFFLDNPAALNLVYPCFTETLASRETVRSCRALSQQLLDKIDLRSALTKPIGEQLSEFRALVDEYAEEISVSFSRQDNEYAYYGEYLPLKIRTTYVEHFIERDYVDYWRTSREVYDDFTDYFSDYLSIFATVDQINLEIERSLEYFGLQETAGIVAMNWICTDTSYERFDKPDANYYYYTYDNPYHKGTIYLTRIDAFLHEYFHHIDAVTDDKLAHDWQSQAFAELGSAQSLYSQYTFGWIYTHDENAGLVFSYCFDREYRGTMEDYYDAYDLLCYSWSVDEPNYYDTMAINSLTHYLLGLYDEETVVHILLFPDTVEDTTGKTWDDMVDCWWQDMNERFKNLADSLPDA